MWAVAQLLSRPLSPVRFALLISSSSSLFLYHTRLESESNSSSFLLSSPSSLPLLLSSFPTYLSLRYPILGEIRELVYRLRFD